MEESFFMNLQRSTFLVLHIVFMLLNRSLISCYVEKRRQCFRQKKVQNFAFRIHRLPFACMYSVLYWISHYVDDFATNRTKRSTLNIKRWQLLLGGGSKQRPILNTTTTQYIRVSKKEEGDTYCSCTLAVFWCYNFWETTLDRL